MSDDPTAPVPLDPVEPELDALDAPDALDEEATAANVAPMRAVAPDPEVDRSRGLARDLALGAIAFVAVLLLLLGATRLMQRGAGEPTSSASQVAAAPSLSPTPSDTASPTPVPSAGPGGSAGSATPSGSPGASPSFSFPIDDPVLVGAGDIAACGATGDEDTAALLDAIAGTVFTAGDNAYESGSAREFAKCYQPSWGRHLARTRPAPGNHDWGTNGLKGYFDYFGAAAQGPDGSSWYSYDLGTWHIIMLDSSCHEVGGCDAASPQGRWLAADLARSSAACTMAIFHHPRFSSGEHGDIKAMDGFWRPLYAAGVDVIVNGHDHNYERFVPQDPDGKADPTRGIKQFVVGTGGGELRNFVRKAHNSEMRIANGYGVIAFTLHEGTYDWVFTVAGADFQDTGRHACH